MNAFDLNNQILGAAGNGIAAAADRFGERLQEINERRTEQKASDTWKDLAFVHAKQVDELDALLRTQDVTLHKQAALLEAAKKYRAGATSDFYEALQYISKLRERISTIEEALQRESARSAALDEFRRVAVEQMGGQVEAEAARWMDPAKLDELLGAAYDKFMATTSIKQGPPPFPPRMLANMKKVQVK